jgi:drug/metabolite transporter (DMT)-like permease
LSTGHLFIPIIEWIVLKKKVRAASWLAIGISFVGVICVLQPDREIISLFSAIGLFS